MVGKNGSSYHTATFVHICRYMRAHMPIFDVGSHPILLVTTMLVFRSSLIQLAYDQNRSSRDHHTHIYTYTYTRTCQLSNLIIIIMNTTTTTTATTITITPTSNTNNLHHDHHQYYRRKHNMSQHQQLSFKYSTNNPITTTTNITIGAARVTTKTTSSYT